MSTRNDGKGPSVGRAACRALRRHALPLAGIFLAHAALRALALAPLYLWQQEAELGPLLGARWALISAAAYLFAVFPLRAWTGERLRFYSAPRVPRPQRTPYWKYFSRQLLRFARGLMWCAPFLMLLGVFLYAMNNVPLTTVRDYVKRLAALGAVFGAEASVNLGVAIYFALTVFFGLIAAFGWWRDMPMDYLPVAPLGLRAAGRYAAKTRLRSRGDMAKNLLANALLSLPALLGAAAALLPYLREKLNVSDRLTMLQAALQLFKRPLPGRECLLLAAAFLALYLPLCALRKLRSATLVRRLTRELDERGEKRAAG